MAIAAQRGIGNRLADYRPGGDDRCPECGNAHWLVGRSTAECAHCANALPLPFFKVIRLRAAA